MFGGKSKAPQKLETIVGNDSTITGELHIKGTLRVDGYVDGDIQADWVIVGEPGRIKGNVRARGVVVGGRVNGNVDADELVELKGKAQVVGEICAVKIAMSEGAIFEGRSSMKRTVAGGRESGEPSEALLPSSG